MFDEHIEKIQALRKSNEPFAVATVVWRAVPSSGKSGDKAVIDRWGDISGWVGGGCVRNIILKEAADAITSGRPRLVKIGQSTTLAEKEGIVTYKMTCQSEGEIDVFIEPVLPCLHMVVMGKTAIARALVRLGKSIGYRVTAVAENVRPDTFDGPDELITQMSLSRVKTSPLSFIIVSTQGEGDEQALTEALGVTSAYVGFVASRKKKEAVFAQLKDTGMDAQKLDFVHSPAGLDIKAKQPEEVAVSILAEIIQVRNNLSVTRAGKMESETAPSQDNPAPGFYINPVCGLPVDMRHPKHVIEYKGESVYFCCDGCKDQFQASPEKFMTKTAT